MDGAVRNGAQWLAASAEDVGDERGRRALQKCRCQLAPALNHIGRILREHLHADVISTSVMVLGNPCGDLGVIAPTDNRVDELV